MNSKLKDFFTAQIVPVCSHPQGKTSGLSGVGVFKISEFGPPSSPGVYAVVLTSRKTSRMRIFYVGSSHNMAKRLLSRKHPYRKLFERFTPSFLVAAAFLETESYKKTESLLISLLKPVMNKHGK